MKYIRVHQKKRYFKCLITQTRFLILNVFKYFKYGLCEIIIYLVLWYIEIFLCRLVEVFYIL